MKTFQLMAMALLFLCFACNKEDDGETQSQQQTNRDLLVSGKWYFESKSSGTYTNCEKRGYIQFGSDGNFTINVFDDSSGSCVSLGISSATYTLENGVNLTLSDGDETQSVVINSISENRLEVTNSEDDETLVFDKTEG